MSLVGALALGAACDSSTPGPQLASPPTVAAPVAATQPEERPTSTLLPGGASPDGRYEVHIVKTDNEPSNYRYVVVDAASGRAIETLDEGGGYFDYDHQARSGLVRWHSSGRFFALADRGTQHSQELYVYEVTMAGVVRVPLPDYVQNALGRVGAVAVDISSVTEPLVWVGDLLSCRLTFDVTSAERGRRVHRVDLALRLWYGPHATTQVSLASMGAPGRR